jgi:hypothetical protein
MECLDAIEDVIQVIQMIRNDPDEEYKYIFEEAADLAKHTGTTIKNATIGAQTGKRKTVISNCIYNDSVFSNIEIMSQLLTNMNNIN